MVTIGLGVVGRAGAGLVVGSGEGDVGFADAVGVEDAAGCAADCGVGLRFVVGLRLVWPMAIDEKVKERINSKRVIEGFIPGLMVGVTDESALLEHKHTMALPVEAAPECECMVLVFTNSNKTLVAADDAAPAFLDWSSN